MEGVFEAVSGMSTANELERGGMCMASSEVWGCEG